MSQDMTTPASTAPRGRPPVGPRVHVNLSPEDIEWLDGVVEERANEGVPATRAAVIREIIGEVRRADELERLVDVPPGMPPSADMDLAQVVAELQDIYRSAVTEPETGNAWRDGYVTGYVRAMRTALTIAAGTPPETPTTPVDEADRRNA